MAVNLSPVGGVAAQFFDNSGQVLTGGLLYTYFAGTTTPATTYTTSSGITAQPNPIVFNAAGRVPDSGEIWLSDGILYKFVLKDQYGVQIATYDNIDGINSNFLSYTSQSEVQTAVQAQTVFTLTTIQYTPATNNLAVFVNGSKQITPTNYAETDSITITFASGLNVGDIVQFSTATPVAANVANAANILYNEGATGAVDRTVESKLQEMISVGDFGAIGDGVANDTAAVQAAIDALPASGGTVYFPSNFNCGVNSTITISGNNITLQFADWTAGITPIASMTNMISVTGDGVKFFNGNFSNQLSYATNAINRSGTVAFGMTVSGCYFASFTNGIVWSAAGNAGLTAQNNFFNSHTSASIRFNEDGRNSVLTENQILGGVYGVYATHTTQQVEGLVIQNNLIQTTLTSNSCIFLNGALYTNITNNNLSGGACIYLLAGVTDHQIAYTVISGNYLGAFAAGTGLVCSGNNSYMMASNNLFDGGANTVGANLTDVVFARFTDNSFVNMTGTQIVTTTCTYNNFFGNQLRGTGLAYLEDATSQAVWVGNFGSGTKSPRSYFLWNWQDDVLSTGSNWTSYTPTIASSSGTITSYTATGAYRRLGTTVEITINVTVTDGGTGSGQVIVQLPIASVASLSQSIAGAQVQPTPVSVYGVTNSSLNLVVQKYEGSYAGSTGAQFVITGSYQSV